MIHYIIKKFLQKMIILLFPLFPCYNLDEKGELKVYANYEKEI